MWANRDWVGRYLPADTKPGHELVAYARMCTAVEGNTTFYALPTETAVARWADDAPADFRFVCKLPRTITHDRRLRNAEDELREFVERMAPLGDRLGPTSIQLPASFGPEDLPVLERFLGAVPSGLRWAVEVRHPDFAARGRAEEAIDDLLHRHGVDRVIIDTRAVFAGPRETPAEIEAFERKPRLAVRPTATGESPIVRFIGQTDLRANPSFWESWLGPVARWIEQGKSPIVFLHTPDNTHAPPLARAFHKAVAARVTDLTPLPDPLPVEPQASLFPDRVVTPEDGTA